MNTADKITMSRLVMAPVFFVLFTYPLFPARITIFILWALFVAIELSDLIDGKVARASGEVSDFGKLFDPFADVVARLTYFVCFAFRGIMPLWILLIILYREFSVMFLRMLLGFKGIAMGARPGGKLKAGLYMASGLLSLLFITVGEFGLFPDALPVFEGILAAVYVVAGAASLASFVDYVIQYRKITKAAS